MLRGEHCSRSSKTNPDLPVLTMSLAELGAWDGSGVGDSRESCLYTEKLGERDKKWPAQNN